MIRVILSLTAALLLALAAPTPALAQSRMGPPGFANPSPVVPSLAPAGSTDTLDGSASSAARTAALTDLNPAEILANAARVLPADAGASDQEKKTGGLSTAINIILVLTVISLAPSILLMTTCFLRISIVLALLKQALGTQMPPSQVMLGLALILTLLVMGPTLDRVNREAIQPYRAGEIRDYSTLWDRAKQPMRDFMFDQIDATHNWSGVYMVLNYRGVDTSHPEKLTRADVDMTALVPAFVLSELKVAFLMGFRVYLPFLVIDMVVSSLLISMSMMMLPPVTISLPFKLLLFVLVDGWQLVCGSLLASFVTHPTTATALSTLLPFSPFAIT